MLAQFFVGQLAWFCSEWLASAGVEPAVVPTVRDPAAAVTATQPIQSTLVIGCAACDLEALIAALALRLPDKTWQRLGQSQLAVVESTLLRVFARGETESVVQVEVPSRAVFQLIVPIALADARAPREIATALANLLAGIEDGSAQPAVVEDVIAAPPELAPPVVDPPAPSTPPSLPSQPPPSVVSTPVGDVKESAAYRPRWQLDAGVVSLQGVGLKKWWRAAGLELTPTIRLGRGALLHASARYLAAPADHAQISRFRMAFGGGYAWDLGAWTLTTVAAASLEPWWLIGSTVKQTTTPLVGALVRFQACWRWSSAVGQYSTRWATGPSLDVSWSGEVDAGFRRVAVRRQANGAVVAALGGAEVGVSWLVGFQRGRWSTPERATKRSPTSTSGSRAR